MKKHTKYKTQKYDWHLLRSVASSKLFNEPAPKGSELFIEGSDLTTQMILTACKNWFYRNTETWKIKGSEPVKPKFKCIALSGNGKHPRLIGDTRVGVIVRRLA